MNTLTALRRNLRFSKRFCPFRRQRPRSTANKWRADGLIKIGHTAVDVDERISELQTGNPAFLKLLGVKPGTKKDEARLHRQFKHAREYIAGRGRQRITARGEWFYPKPDLMDYISKLRSYDAPLIPPQSS